MHGSKHKLQCLFSSKALLINSLWNKLIFQIGRLDTGIENQNHIDEKNTGEPNKDRQWQRINPPVLYDNVCVIFFLEYEKTSFNEKFIQVLITKNKCILSVNAQNLWLSKRLWKRWKQRKRWTFKKTEQKQQQQQNQPYPI